MTSAHGQGLAPDQAVSARVDALFAEWDRADSPGCALGIVQGGELVYARGYGMANLELGVPISPASVFHVASVSKQFTAISVALLAQEGKLALDDDVREYVPELPDLGHTITLRHLIHHTSGLRDQYGLFRLAGWRDDDVQAFDDVLAFALGHRRLNFPPGSEYAYCNTSYTLLALVVERVSGQRLRQFARERIFAPLGMARSHIHDDVTEIVPNRASGYAPKDDGDGFKVNDSNVEAFGAICVYTSVEDLARWVRNFGRRHVAGEVIARAIAPGHLNDGTPLRYGYGLALHSYRGLKTVSHGGVDSGYRAEMLWFPEVDFGVVVLANLSAIKPGALARQVADLYLADRLQPDDLLDAPAVTLPEREQQALTGLYREERTALTRLVKLEEGKLTVNTAFGDRLELTPIGAGRFRLGQPPVEVHISRHSDGTGTMEYRELATDGRVGVFLSAAKAIPSVEELAGYAGTYVCPEINARQTFVVRDGKLVLRRRKVADCDLEPTVNDAFNYPQFDVVFSRDLRGNVSGFDVYTERIRALRFERAL